MFDVLMYLFETYIHSEAEMRVDQDKLTRDLTDAAGQKCGPLRRQADVSGAAVEQPDPQFMLKPGDILTHRRGRYAQQPGGLNKA